MPEFLRFQQLTLQRACKEASVVDGFGRFGID
jgi:hypothetical protein